MNRAIAFYEKYFDKKVDTFDKRYSIFIINSFSFGLFNPKQDNEEVVFGNNVIPNIEVKDAKKEYDRVKNMGIKIALGLTDINGYQLFQFKDSEGNVIEIYSK